MTFTVRVSQASKNTPWTSSINKPQFQEGEMLPVREYLENGLLITVYPAGYAIGVIAERMGWGS